MEWFAVPKEEPSVIFPIGSVLEDHKGKYKVLAFEKQDKVHKYKVEVLEQKTAIPKEFQPYLDSKIQTFVVLAQNLAHIKRIE